MGQQIRKVTKRRRRVEYIKRKKEQSKLNSNTPIRLAVPVAKDAKPAAKEAPAKKTAAGAACGHGPGGRGGCGGPAEC